LLDLVRDPGQAQPATLVSGSIFRLLSETIRASVYVYLHRMRKEIHQSLPRPELGPCVCSEVRKLARRLSSFYDSALAPEDLTITQYSLLANIARAGQLSHTVLAEKVGMERTTLTRNLRPLTRAKLIVVATGLDRRQHLLQLTTAGKRKLARSLPLWEEAQRQFLSYIGSKSIKDLRALLGSAEAAVTKAVTGNQEKPESAR
jgi:DNA-binding MarR family transcriptional regulator